MAPRKRWPWLRVDRLLGEYRIGRDSAVGRRRLEEELERRRSGENGTEFQAVRREWIAQRLAMGSASRVSHCLRFR